MAKPYSIDLRERAVGRVVRGGECSCDSAGIECQPIERGEVVATIPGDGECSTWSNGRQSPAEDRGRAPAVAFEADRHCRVHFARVGSRVGRAWS